ncbi:DMT family transporter [Limoniibacter endophyticus]|uniref:EamA domain-containing protein n=1 Tax=Limoniibacter endophyticus TaxID=1565040 RepID=A0A8J3GG97_9HYPH|nr:DMT family transporter [Limoniibacter endophyticus]GHC64197.1 hypothetical protein GCM10010136_06020 [Limoniibacter endophyticus]
MTDRVAHTGASAPTLAAIFCFSAGPVGFAVQKYLAISLSPVVVIAVQMTIGAIILWTIAFMRTTQAVPLKTKLKAVGVGALHPGIFMIIFTTASRQMDGVTANLLAALMPAIVGFLARIFLAEPLKLSTLAGMAVSFAGLVLVISERKMTGESTLYGFLLAALGFSFAAAGQIAGRALHTRVQVPWQVVATMQVSGAAGIAWLSVFAIGAQLDLAAIASEWIAFSYIGAVVMAAGYAAYNFALSRLPILQLGLLAAIGPAVGAISAAIIFDSPMGLPTMAGILVIVTGTALPSLLGFARHRQSVAHGRKP